LHKQRTGEHNESLSIAGFVNHNKNKTEALVLPVQPGIFKRGTSITHIVVGIPPESLPILPSV
jgi:hypothetical protein